MVLLMKTKFLLKKIIQASIFFRKLPGNEKMNCAYNATTDWCTNKEMTRAIADCLKKPLWLPAVPSFILKIILGEMTDVVLNGSKVSCEKIKMTGYRHRFTDLNEALKNLLE